jgi:Zn-finger nucleic acid-binding protein
MGAEYFSHGSITMGYNMAPCCLVVFFGLVIALGISIFNIVVSVNIASTIRTAWSYRAVYIFVLYPLVLIGFIADNAPNSFFTMFLYGFPVFAIGAVLMPLAAIALHRTTSKAIKDAKLPVVCPRCMVYVYVPRFNKLFACPKCRGMYMNPLAGISPEDVQVLDEPAPKRKVLRKKRGRKDEDIPEF